MPIVGTPTSELPSWPVESFNNYLLDAMKRAGFASRHALAETGAVSAMLLSDWKNGKVRPGLDALTRVAEALGVPKIEMWIQAGLVSRDELIIDGLPDDVPAELHQLMDLHRKCNAEEREALRSDLGLLLDTWLGRLEFRQRMERRKA